MKMSGVIFMQCLLCVLLAAFCLTLQYRKANLTSQAGTFGFREKSNDTLTHLAQNIYGEVCHEQSFFQN